MWPVQRSSSANKYVRNTEPFTGQGGGTGEQGGTKTSTNFFQSATQRRRNWKMFEAAGVFSLKCRQLRGKIRISQMESVCNDEQEWGRSRRRSSRRSSRRIQVLLYGGCWCLYVQKVTNLCWEGQYEGSVLTELLWKRLHVSQHLTSCWFYRRSIKCRSVSNVQSELTSSAVWRKSWCVTDTPTEVSTLTN